MDEELDRFKRYDLRLYAASQGFIIDRKKSSRASTVMRLGHEKVIISRQPDGHFTYWSPHDDTDRGSIVDFVQRRKGLTLGGVRKELREWTGLSSPTLSQLPELSSGGKDLGAVRKRFAAMPIAKRHAFLENERGIPSALLAHWRFYGTVRRDRYNAAVFGHYDTRGDLCGYEIKNSRGFTGFSPGGRKQLWLSNTRSDDLRLVICESAIDALSHAAVFDDSRARYASIAGKTTAAQHPAMRAAILEMPPNSEIVAAMDADSDGRKLAELVRTIVVQCGRSDVSFRSDEPECEKDDWNDVLRRKRRMPLLPRRRDEPSIA